MLFHSGSADNAQISTDILLTSDKYCLHLHQVSCSVGQNQRCARPLRRYSDQPNYHCYGNHSAQPRTEGDLHIMCYTQDVMCLVYQFGVQCSTILFPSVG